MHHSSLIAFFLFSWSVACDGNSPSPVQAPSTDSDASLTSPDREAESRPAKTRSQTEIQTELRAANPGYDGKGQFGEDGGRIVAGQFDGTGIEDLTPLSGLPINRLSVASTLVRDLSPLAGLPLEVLWIEETRITDLSPLRGMKLTELRANKAPVANLHPLFGMPLSMLYLVDTRVGDLKPLAGMPLNSLWLNRAPVKDIRPLAGSPLVSLTLEGTRVDDLSPLADIRSLQRLHIGDTPVTDLRPLKNLTLTRLIFTPRRIAKGLKIVREMQSLRELGATLEQKMPPAQFWSLWDAGKIK